MTTQNLYISNHPLILHKLSIMRDKNTNQREFSAALYEISLLMGYEITRNLELSTRPVNTPLESMDAPTLKNSAPVIVPILRAGLGMSKGLETLLPDSQIGHIGLYRDEETHKPVEYLIKLPKFTDQTFIIVDPMLATGNSAVHAINILRSRDIPENKIVILSLVGAPEGVEEVHKHYPSIPIHMAALDEKLNDTAYIVPGLGDAGDRLFGTL